MTLSGTVKSFPSTDNAQSKIVQRKIYDPAVASSSQGLSKAVVFQNGEAGDDSISRDDMVPASALVSIFLLTDVNFAEPIATVKTDDEGNYNIRADDVRDYLLDKNLIDETADDDTVITAFRALGKLQVRALVVKEDSDGNRRALAIQSISDPNDVDPVTNEPVPATVDPIVHRVVKSIVNQIKESIQQLEDLGIAPAVVQSLTETVVTTVTEQIEQVLEETETTVITIPEGQTLEDVVNTQEDEFEVVVEEEELDQIEQVLTSTEEDETLIEQLEQNVAAAEEVIDEEESTLESSLDSESQGLLSGLEAALNDNVSDEVEDAIEEAETNGTLEDLLVVEDGSDAETALAAARAEKLIQQRNNLQRFFMAMGLSVVVDENEAGDAAVIAVRLPVPFHIPAGNIPGGRFGDRNVRLFKVGEGTLDVDSNFTTDDTAALGVPDSDGQPQAPLYYAQPLSGLVSNLLGDQTLEDFQATVDAAFAEITNPQGTPTGEDFDLIDRLNVYHDLSRRLQETSLVSTAVITRLIENADSTIQLKRLAAVIAENFSWVRESVNLTPEGLPIFTGRREPLAGGASTVDSSEIVKTLSLNLADTATATAQQLTQRVSFYAQFAPDAVQSAIERQRFEQGGNFDLILALLDVYPQDAAAYRDIILGGDGLATNRAYASARDRVARGLSTAVPSTLFGRSLNSESSINVRSALFLMDFVLKSKYLIEATEGYFDSITIVDDSNNNNERLVPNFGNYKFLVSEDTVTVATLVSSLLNITEIDNGSFFRSVKSTVTAGLSGLPELPEFKEQNIEDFADDLTSQADSVSMSCTVERFDGADPQNLADTTKDLSIQVVAVEYNETTGQFFKGDAVDVTVESEIVSSEGEPVRRTYTVSGIPTSVEGNYGRDFVARLMIPSYQNDLPELFFWADGYVPDIVLCDEQHPLFIGPDQEFVPVPGLGMVSDQTRLSFDGTQELLEGIDVSNFELPGAPMYLTSDEQTAGDGEIDFTFVSTETGYAIESIAESGVAFAPLFGGYVDGSLEVSIDPASELDPLHGIFTIMGSNIRSLLETVSSDDSLMTSSIDIDPENFEYDRLYLMRDAEGKFWILELRFIDIFEEFDASLRAFTDLGFARVNSLGEIDIPEAAFDAGPGPGGFGDHGGIRYFKLFYGDWLVLEAPEQSEYFGPELLPAQEVSFGEDPSYGQLAAATDGVFFRYASEHFEENITRHEDFDSVFGNPPDFSTIPVRLDAGRAGITFVKLSFNKQDRKYVMSRTPADATDFVTQLKHNNIIAVFDDMSENPDSPAYLGRVIREIPADDPHANFEINIEFINFAEFSGDEDPTNDVVCFTEDATDGCPADMPELQVSADDTLTAVGAVYDGDFDGVPALFDPNDSDPNIPGSAPSAGGGGNNGGPGGGFFEGLHISMMADADGRSFLVETENVYPGDIQSVAINSAIFGESAGDQVVFNCTAPRMDNDGNFIDYQCNARDVDGDVTVSLQSKMGDRIAFKLAVPSSTLETLGNRVDMEYTINYRAPVDLDGNPFMCGTEACPARPSTVGMATVNIMPEVGVLDDMSITVGSGDPESLSGINSIDVSRPLTITANRIPGAMHYDLIVFCPGSQPGEAFLPEENIYFGAPGRDETGREVQPRFDFDLAWLGGRTCDFTLSAFLESTSGEFLGVSTLTIDDKVFEGSTDFGFIDNEIKVAVGGAVCYEQFDDGHIQVGTENCSAENTLFTLDSTGSGEPTATLTLGSIVTEAHADGGRRELTAGQLAADAIVSFNVDLDVAEGEEIQPPDCGSISSDPFSNFCDATNLVSTDFFQVSEDGTLLTIVDGLPFPVSFKGGLSSIPLTESGFYALVDEEEQEIVEVGIDVFSHTSEDGTGTSVETEIWARFTLVAGGNNYNGEGDATFNVTSPGFMFINTENGQPFDFDIRFIRDGLMKVAWFVPPPRFAIDGEHDINGDGTADVSVTYESGLYTLVFADNVEWVEQYTHEGPVQLEEQEDGTFMATVEEDIGFTEFGINFGNVQFNMFMEMRGEGDGHLEWFEVFHGGGGPGDGGAGDCYDCPVPLFEFGVKGPDAMTLYRDEAGFNMDQGDGFISVQIIGESIVVSLPEGVSGITLRSFNEMGEELTGEALEFPRFLPYPIFVDYYDQEGNGYYMEVFDTSFDIFVRVFEFHGNFGGGGDGEEPRAMIDTDMDGLYDHEDNCFAVANEDQLDVNPANGIGDVCEAVGPDMSGIYLVDLVFVSGSTEFDEEVGDCMPTEDMSMLVMIEMQGSQYRLRTDVSNRGDRDHDGGLYGIMDANGGFSVMGGDGMQSDGGVYDEVTDTFSFQFIEFGTSDDGSFSCEASASVSGAGPTEVNEEDVFTNGGVSWFEGDFDFYSGYAEIEYGVVEDGALEAFYSWDFDNQSWAPESVDTSDLEYFVTANGLQQADDILTITGYLDAGEVAIIQPTFDGVEIADASEHVELSELDISGLYIGSVLGEGIAMGLSEGAMFSEGSRAYVTEISVPAPIYEVDCDASSWMAEADLVCANFVVTSQDASGVTTFAVSLDEVVASPSELDGGLAPMIYVEDGNDGMYNFNVFAALISDDSNALGANLHVRYMRLGADGTFELITEGAVTSETVGGFDLLVFEYPEAVLDMVDNNEDSAQFVFVESQIDSSALVRTGYKVLAGEEESVLTINSVARDDVVNNFALQSPGTGGSDLCDPNHPDYPDCGNTCEPGEEGCDPNGGGDPNCDPSVDPNCDTTGGGDPNCDPSMDPDCVPHCDPSVDPNCDTTGGGDPNCDPSMDPDCLPHCDPSVDPNCDTTGGGDPDCDPSMDPDCVPHCDPSVDPNCDTTGGGDPTCDPSIESCPGDPVAGKTAYDMQCASCHGANGSSDSFSDPLIPLKDVYGPNQQHYVSYVVDTMPLGNGAACDAKCASDIFAHMLDLEDAFSQLP